MKILFCAANAWPSPSHVGSHQLATAFAHMGHSVAFISDPISPLHQLSGASTELRDRFDLWRGNGNWLQEFRNGGKIWAYVPAALLTPHNKPILRSTFVTKNWHKFTFPNIYPILKKNGFTAFDLVYIDSPPQAYWWRQLVYKKAVFRLADNPAGFEKHTPAAEEALVSLGKKTDLTLYTAPSLKNLAQKYSQNIFYFPNAVNYNFFAKPAPCPQEYKDENRSIVLYVGAIDYWFDWDFLIHAADSLPDRAFFIIGHCKKAPQDLARLKNLYFLGPRNYKELPGYMQHANVGIIPFATSKYPELVHSINPLKLYEYMGSGLPVISTGWKMLEEVNSPAMLAKTKEEFVKLIETASAHTAAPLPLVASQTFAAKFSWEKQAKTLLEHLGLCK